MTQETMIFQVLKKTYPGLLQAEVQTEAIIRTDTTDPGGSSQNGLHLSQSLHLRLVKQQI